MSRPGEHGNYEFRDEREDLTGAPTVELVWVIGDGSPDRVIDAFTPGQMAQLGAAVDRYRQRPETSPDDDEIDHSKCPPSAHDFDPEGTEPGLQKIDAHGRRLCNDCGALCFYCTRDEWYHHAPATAGSCFLCKDGGWDVLIPDAIPVPAGWPGNECNRLPA